MLGMDIQNHFLRLKVFKHLRIIGTGVVFFYENSEASRVSDRANNAVRIELHYDLLTYQRDINFSFFLLYNDYRL